MEPLKERLLEYYSWDEEEFAENTREPSFLRLPSLEGDQGAMLLVRRLLLAVKNKEKVLIYGDYDTDGILATSIMVRSLLLLGLKASYFIPSRYRDGYGLNLENAKKIASGGYSLVLCVDNGVSCLEPVRYLKEKGVDTLIIDHHEFGKELPEAIAIVHPLLCGLAKDASFNVSAGFLSYLVSALLLKKNDPYLMVLAAVTTLSDLMPLVGCNREIVRLALMALEKSPAPELSALTDSPKIDERTLSMSIIPTINALGRMEKEYKARRAVAYFSYREADNRNAYASWMKDVNQSRKERTKALVKTVSVTPGASGICLEVDALEGLNGLLANRLMKAYRLPTCVFSSAEKDPSVLVGSLRSEKGFSVLDCLQELSPYCLTSGGHDRAGGLSIRKEDFSSFRKAFLSYCALHPFAEEKKQGIPLLLSECNEESYAEIRRFAPFGEGHPEPLFVLTNLSTDSFQYSKDGRYLISPLGYGVKMVSFSLGKKDFAQKEKTSLYARFRRSYFRNKAGLDIEVAASSND